MKNLFFVGLLAFASSLIAQETNIIQEFSLFKQKYRKSYMGNEEMYRQQIYMKNKQKIDNHNAKKNKTYTMEINSFADLTLEQFKTSYLGTSVRSSTLVDSVQEPLVFDGEVQIDWQKEGKVTRVKNQYMCASCWAFASIGSVQSAYMIKKGLNQEFSEQQLVDCSTSYGNKGCHGGELEYTFLYLQKKGVKTEQSYPYVGKDKNCKASRGGPYKIVSYNRDITCGGLYRSLLNGPVTVAVEALFWGFYKEGIYDDCGNQINHGVLVVGVTKDYWLVKNSWGAQWGDKGYIKLARGNTCSVCEYPYSPIL